MGVTAHRYGVYFEDDEKALKLDCSDGDDCITEHSKLAQLCILEG